MAIFRGEAVTDEHYFSETATGDGTSPRDPIRTGSPVPKVTDQEEVEDAVKALNNISGVNKSLDLDNVLGTDENKHNESLPDFGIDLDNTKERINTDHSYGLNQLEEEEKEDKAVIEERKRKEAEEAEWLSKYKDP